MAKFEQYEGDDRPNTWLEISAARGWQGVSLVRDDPEADVRIYVRHGTECRDAHRLLRMILEDFIADESQYDRITTTQDDPPPSGGEVIAQWSVSIPLGQPDTSK